MDGARALVETAVRCGVEVCFANPGTTELAIVAALEAEPRLRAVLGLAEGVLTGAADGYGRMRERPALTLMHLGPSLCNGLANLHNARRARSPIVNLVGDHPTWHRTADPPMATDIESLARPVSDWVRSVTSANALPGTIAEAIATARPGRVATVVVPADVQWGEAEPVAAPPSMSPAAVDADQVARAVEALRRDGAALLLGGHALRERGLAAAGRIARATSCRLLAESFPSRLDAGRGRPRVERVSYVAEMARASLASLRSVVLVGAVAPVPYFAGRERVDILGSGTATLQWNTDRDEVSALETLAEALGAPREGSSETASLAREAERPTGPLNARSIAAAIASVLPEHGIVIDEGVSLAGGMLAVAQACPPFSYLSLTGGALGFGLPCAVGAAVACPGRKVVVVAGDGSALYTPQALWTLAKEGLDVVVVLCANDAYRILQLELARRGENERGAGLTSIGNPAIAWRELASGFGVPSSRATTADELSGCLQRAMAAPGPHLVEARIP